jgi:hypothetical protein
MILTMAIRCRAGVLRRLTLCALGLAIAGGCARDPPTEAAALTRALGKEIDRYVQSDRAAPAGALPSAVRRLLQHGGVEEEPGR